MRIGCKSQNDHVSTYAVFLFVFTSSWWSSSDDICGLQITDLIVSKNCCKVIGNFIQWQFVDCSFVNDLKYFEF